MSSTAWSPRLWSRAVITVRAPARASATAVALPIPELAPVTITVLPVMDLPVGAVASLMGEYPSCSGPLTSGS